MARSERPSRHVAARVDDAVQAWRVRRARRRGRRPEVIPFTGYGSSAGWIRVLGRVVMRTPATSGSDDRLANIRGWRSFTSIPVADVQVRVRAGAGSRTVRTDRGGVLDARIDVELEPGWRTVHLTIDGADDVEAPVFVADDRAGFGIVSDVDDTVMVTALPRPLLAGWNTFVLDEHARRPVAGMAVLYERLTRANPGAPVVYLSTGAWNVAPTLTRFLRRNLYPRGALLLTDWGPTPDRWFRNGAEHKRRSLERLAEEFPRVRWLLVGDDGQHDERIYGDFAHSHPGHVRAVAIRRLTAGESVLAGGRRGGAGSGDADVPWITASDGAGLDDRLRDIGVL